MSKFSLSDNVDFKKKYMITTRLFVIEKDIQKMYGGGIGKVTMCLNTFQKDYELTDKSKMLKEVGIASA